MPEEGARFGLHKAAAAAVRLVLLAVVFPSCLAVLAGVPPHLVMALVGSTLVIEYGAGAVGIGLGLAPGLVMFIVSCTELGVVLFLLDIFEILGERSPALRHFSSGRGAVRRIQPCCTGTGYTVSSRW